MTQNYKITVSYDGTDYYGWQRQPNKKTIQGALEEALFPFQGKKISVIGAGRTDAGVHAQGQVANFKADFKLTDEELLKAVNSKLPEDIRIIDLEKVEKDFHARKSARSKIYQYRILNSARISPYVLRFVLYWPSALDVDGMREGARLFEREADFTAFSSNRNLPAVRKVFHSEINTREDEILYTVEANGFLKYMVRTMLGTLLAIGRRKMAPEEIEQLFSHKERTLSSPTAPAKGLCLLRINYPELFIKNADTIF